MFVQKTDITATGVKRNILGKVSAADIDPLLLPYVHTQNTPASVWICNHDKGFNPTIRVKNFNGAELDPGIDEIDEDTIHLHFNDAVSGKAFFTI